MNEIDYVPEATLNKSRINPESSPHYSIYLQIQEQDEQCLAETFNAAAVSEEQEQVQECEKNYEQEDQENQLPQQQQREEVTAFGTDGQRDPASAPTRGPGGLRIPIPLGSRQSSKITADLIYQSAGSSARGNNQRSNAEQDAAPGSTQDTSRQSGPEKQRFHSETSPTLRQEERQSAPVRPNFDTANDDDTRGSPFVALRHIETNMRQSAPEKPSIDETDVNARGSPFVALRPVVRPERPSDTTQDEERGSPFVALRPVVRESVPEKPSDATQDVNRGSPFVALRHVVRESAPEKPSADNTDVDAHGSPFVALGPVVRQSAPEKPSDLTQDGAHGSPLVALRHIGPVPERQSAPERPVFDVEKEKPQVNALVALFESPDPANPITQLVAKKATKQGSTGSLIIDDIAADLSARAVTPGRTNSLRRAPINGNPGLTRGNSMRQAGNYSAVSQSGSGLRRVPSNRAAKEQAASMSSLDNLPQSLTKETLPSIQKQAQ